MTDSKEMQKVLQVNRQKPTTMEDLDKRIFFLVKALNETNIRVAKLEYLINKRG